MLRSDAWMVMPTQEEIDATDRRMAEQLAKMLMARSAIVNNLGGPEKSMTGASDCIDCPVCGQSVSLQFSTHNGHIHAVCKTDGCVSWME